MPVFASMPRNSEPALILIPRVTLVRNSDSRHQKTVVMAPHREAIPIRVEKRRHTPLLCFLPRSNENSRQLLESILKIELS
jgi:hypothetical protein